MSNQQNDIFYENMHEIKSGAFKKGRVPKIIMTKKEFNKLFIKRTIETTRLDERIKIIEKIKSIGEKYRITPRQYFLEEFILEVFKAIKEKL